MPAPTRFLLPVAVVLAGAMVSAALLVNRPAPPDPPPAPPAFPSPSPHDRISADALAALKHSTVYIEVDDIHTGGGTGTGFFAGEPGLIVTNSHVVGLLHPGGREPATITVFTDCGVKGKQKQYTGPKVKVLAVDRDMDLAVLQLVNETDLPPPLPMRPAAELRELDRLVCLGFPGGRRLSERNRSTEPPAVSVSESAVSAFRHDDGGNLYTVQIQGGVVHGHSGGPVCDPDGNVVGVAVRVDTDHRARLTGIAYAVPSESVVGLLAGRAGDATFGQSFVRGGRVVFPVSVKCADALGRLQAVGVAAWVGDGGAVRPAGDQHTAANGDAEYGEVPLLYDRVKQVATGEVSFPATTDGRVYWVQPFYTNALTPKRYLAGKPLPVDSPPVELAAATLEPRFPVGVRFRLSVSHSVKVSEHVQNGGKDVLDGRVIDQHLTATETVGQAVGTADHAHLGEVLEPGGWTVELRAPEASAVAGGNELADAKAAFAGWSGVIPVGSDGRPDAVPTGKSIFLQSADKPQQAVADRLGAQFADALGEGFVKLPGKQVQPGDTWTHRSPRRLRWHPAALLADPPGQPPAVPCVVTQDTTFTYLGRRERAGRTEAVLKAEGVLTAADATSCGTVIGQVVLDATSGMVADADWTREFVLTVPASGGVIRATGTEAVKVSRER